MNKFLRFRSIVGLFALTALSFTGKAQDSAMVKAAPEKWDLRRCVDYALANNISIKQSDVQARLSKLTLEQSRMNQIPTLNLGTGLGVNSGRSQNPSNYTLSTNTYFANSWQLQANVNVFNFFSVQNAIAANRYAWQAALANSDKLKNDISLNVANAYLQVLMSMEQANAAQNQLRLSQTQLETTRKRVMAGALPELNAAELEAQVAKDSASLISLSGTVQQNVLGLKAYMALDAGVPFEVATPPVDVIPVERLEDLQPETVYALALYNQPLQKMDQLQVQSAQKAVKANRGAMYPTFSLGGGLSTNFVTVAQEPILSTLRPKVDTVARVAGTNTKVVQDGFAVDTRKTPYFKQLDNNFAQFVSLNINIPILSNGSLRTNYQKSRLNLRNVELTREQDNLTLKQNIYQAYTAAMTARQNFEAYKISVASTQKSYEFARKRYDVGMLSTIDLLTNQNNYFIAQINALSSHYDFVFKMKVLEFYKGMGIKL